ncbi:MAG: hypothetical protein HUJ54_05365 [Erysipelotrichaceae bacterium]|nr:hypothetical protein [Erysipelotrichaceae bacterium]
MKKMRFAAVFFALLLMVAGCSNAVPFEIKTVTVDEVAQKMANRETFVLQVERENCPFCAATDAYLDETQKEHPNTVLYRLDSTSFELMREQEGDMTLISKTEEGRKFLDLFPYFLYTPTVYLIKDGTPVSAGIGYDEKNHTFSEWNVDSTINWDEAKPVDVWEFIARGQTAPENGASDSQQKAG